MLGLGALLLCVMSAQTTYDYYLSGSQSDARVKTRPGYLLAGGGKDDEASWRWFLDHAAFGDIVVLRASGADGYHAFAQRLGKVDSVESIVFRRREDASDPFLLGRIREADAIFLAGGNQWNYVRLWKDTPVMRELNAAVVRGVPVGGTSAGLAVLGEYGFSAEHDTVTSAEALADPHGTKVAIVGGFLNLPHLRCTITDSHFAKRDRMGRLLVFLNRMAESGCQEARGIGVDEGASVLMEGDGSARVAGTGAAYFVQRDGERFVVDKVPSGGRFDIGKWKAVEAERFTLRIDGQMVRSDAEGVYGGKARIQ